MVSLTSALGWRIRKQKWKAFIGNEELIALLYLWCNEHFPLIKISTFGILSYVNQTVKKIEYEKNLNMSNNQMYVQFTKVL